MALEEPGSVQRPVENCKYLSQNRTASISEADRAWRLTQACNQTLALAVLALHACAYHLVYKNVFIITLGSNF